MSETIKAKTIQRLSSRRRLSCPLRASLSPVRSTIFPLLILLLAVLADASYPSVLPPKPLYAPIVEKKIKKIESTLRNHHPSSSSSSPTRPIEGSWHPKRRPSLPGPCRTPRCPSYEAFADSVVLDADSPICRVLLRDVSTTRSIRDRTHV